MNQRGADQPWHERSILDRIPKPPAAPTKLVIGPETSQSDSASEKHPCDGGPWPRPARPGSVKSPADQGRNRECKRDAEAYITHVQHRRMRNHRRILQQRIEITAIGRNPAQTVKWI